MAYLSTVTSTIRAVPPVVVLDDADGMKKRVP